MGLIVKALFVVFLMGIGTGSMQEAMAQEPAYVGMGKCKLCHIRQHKVWSESKHAMAFDVLSPKEQGDPKCLNCHVTGYRTALNATSEMAGVQCEACHGPGSLYIKIHPRRNKEESRKAGMIAQPNPESCKTCHNEQSPTFKGFDYAKMWEQIRHPK